MMYDPYGWELELVLKKNCSDEKHVVGCKFEVHDRIEQPKPMEMELTESTGLTTMSFDQVVTILKRREYRKDKLILASEKLGQRLVSFLEDKEGWHGRDRKRKIEDEERMKQALGECHTYNRMGGLGDELIEDLALQYQVSEDELKARWNEQYD